MIRNDKKTPLCDYENIGYYFNNDDPLLIAAKELDWPALENIVNKRQSKYFGRPTKNARAKIGTLLIKHIYNMSDRKTVLFVQRDPYAQKLCDLSPVSAIGYMNPSSGLTDLRKLLGESGLSEIQQIICKSKSLKKLTKNKSELILDTTCAPANILYPVDIRLLETARKKAVSFIKDIERALGKSGNAARTYCRKARKTFLQWVKIGRRSKEKKTHFHKQGLQFLNRNLIQLESLIADYQKKINAASGELRESLIKRMRKIKKFMDVAKILLYQQKQIYRHFKDTGNGRVSIAARIVSIFRPDIRPISRGKIPVGTEFGRKISVCKKNKYVFCSGQSLNNKHDSHFLTEALGKFKKLFSHLPKYVYMDRGGDNPVLLKMLKKTFPKIEFRIQKKGKVPHPKAKKISSKTSEMEASVSWVKRCFGLGKVMARLPQNDNFWIELGIWGMNLSKACISQKKTRKLLRC